MRVTVRDVGVHCELRLQSTPLDTDTPPAACRFSHLCLQLWPFSSPWYIQLLTAACLSVCGWGLAVTGMWSARKWQRHPLIKDLASCQEPIKLALVPQSSMLDPSQPSFQQSSMLDPSQPSFQQSSMLDPPPALIPTV